MLAERFTDPSVMVVGGGVDIRSHNFWTLADNISMFCNYLTSRPPGLRQQLPSLNLAIRRQVFHDVGGFDEIQANGIQDTAVLSQLQARGISYGYVGQRQGQVNSAGPLFAVGQMLADPHFQPVYHQDRVWIFKIQQMS